MLDARGRALLPIERFREAAEEHGWILVSSYNTRSDTQDDPNTPAVKAMWKDTHERLAIDDRRVSLTGFSGGARASVGLAGYAPLRVAGVIGCGAGWPDDTAPIPKSPSFAYFGAVGNRDFNYYEMRDLDEKLARARARYRIEVFDGAHDWPPAALAREALAWLELEAMRSGARPPDAAAIAALYAQDLARARGLEAEGRSAEALARYGWIARDFRGLADAGEAEAKAAELGGSAQVRKALKEGRRRDERDRATLRDLSRKLSRAFAASELPLAGLVAAELKIPTLKQKAAAGDSVEERLSAERLLANLRVQTSFYLPERFLAGNDVPHAFLALSIAAEIDPEEPHVYYNLACAAARSGQVARTLRELDRAVAKGFRRFEMIDSDPDFASVRADPAFQKWLADARARTPLTSP
jgi:predicted esterase